MPLKSRIKRQADDIAQNAEEIEEEVSTDDSGSDQPISDRLGVVASAVSVIVALYFVSAIFSGETLTSLMQNDLDMLLMLVVVVSLSLYLANVGTAAFSIPFFVLTFGIVVAGWGVLPQTIKSAIPLEEALGFTIPTADAVSTLTAAVIFAAGYWAVKARFVSSKKKPGTIVDDVSSKFGRVWDVYVNIAQILVLLGFAAVFIVLTYAGDTVGQLGDVLGQAPYLASNAFAVGLGYLGLGGEVPYLPEIPFLGDIGPVGWLFIAGGTLLLAIAIKRSASGPTSRLFR